MTNHIIINAKAASSKPTSDANGQNISQVQSQPALVTVGFGLIFRHR
jgi:hypothetical protein